MQLYTIETGNFKLDGGAMFGVVPKSIWSKLNTADANNMCTWAMRCLLVEDGNKLTLIDTGIGTKQSEKFYSHYYLDHTHTLEKSLQVLGFNKADITDVFLTHLHFDHCGGAITLQDEKFVPAFKNAIYWSNQSHWQWATEPNDREKASFLKENILPIQESGQLQFIDNSAITLITENCSFQNNVQIKFANGHTDSMMLPVIHYKHHKLVYMADLLPSAAHIPLPYIMGYDMFPLKTLHEKKAFLEEALENNYLLYFEHDPVHELCSLKRNEKGTIIADAFYKISDL
jgi:glyoxylase-like metal-dependent hydrolase (beta-lactamase superfamily II)